MLNLVICKLCKVICDNNPLDVEPRAIMTVVRCHVFGFLEIARNVHAESNGRDYEIGNTGRAGSACGCC